MTTKDGAGLTAIGLFRDSLDHEIKTREESLRRRIESLQRSLAQALNYLDKGYRVNSSGIAQYDAIEIDKLCASLNERYDLRIALNAALAPDEKNVDPGLHRGDEKGGAK